MEVSHKRCPSGVSLCTSALQHLHDIDNGVECTPSKFADDTKLSSAVDTLEGRKAIRMDLDRLEKWAHVNLMGFNEAKCKMLHLGQGNLRCSYRRTP